MRGPEKFRLTVGGKPAGAGSKTGMPVRRGKGGPLIFRQPPTIKGGQVWGQPMINYTHQSDRTEPWMKKVIAEARRGWGGDPPLDGALWLDVVFFEDRPESSEHYWLRKSGNVLKPTAPAYPHATAQHDCDKLRRAIADSLKHAEVIVDDKRIVGGQAWKQFTGTIEGFDAPCAYILLGVMAAQTAEQAGQVTLAPEGQTALI